MPANDIVVYAGWKAPTVKVTAYTTKDGGAVHKQFEVGYGEKVSKDDITDLPNDGDKTFIGWATKDNSGKLTLYNFETRLYEDLKLYPYFAGSAKYTVSYDLNGGTGTVVDSKKYMEGAEADVQPFGTAKAPAGKVFLGWLDGQKILLPQDKLVVIGDITLRALYGDIPEKTSLKYSAAYPAGIGMINPPDYAPAELQDLADNSSVKILDLDKTPFETPKGYIFDGWKTADGTRFAPGTTVIVDHLKGQNVLYAVWKQKKVLTVTITGNSGTYKYDGSEKVVTGSTNDAADITETIVTVTKKPSAAIHEKVSAREVGTYEMVLYPGDYEAVSSDPNYDVEIKVKNGSLNITENNLRITVTAVDDSKTYNGKPLINNGFNIEGLPDGLKAEVEVNGSITHVSQNAAGNNVVVSVKILDMAGTDVTNNFPNIVKVNGTLTITPAKLKLKGADHSFLYDGAEHSDETVTIIEGMLFESDKIDVKATGTIRNIGTVPNPVGKVTFIVGEADDYKIEKEDGKLEVTANTQARVKVTAASRSKVYDGTPLTAPDGYEVDNLPQGLRAEAIIEGSITQVKESGTGNNVVKEVKIFDADNNDVTANFPNIDKVNGNLTIMKAPITLTGADGTFNYDGKVHKNETVTKVGEFAAVDTVIYKATGTIKDVGNKPNPVEVKFITGSEDNYDIECIPGTLTVTNSSAQIVVTAEDATKRYDGTPLTNNKFKLENLPEGFTINVLIEGSITHVSENAPNNNKVKEVKIFDDDNKDVTKNFPNLMTVDGTLTITPAPLNLTGETDTFMYDGQEHKNENVIIEGLVGTDEIKARATGRIRYVGTVDNPIEWSFVQGKGDIRDYDISEEIGTLTVEVSNSIITVTAVDDSKTYNGKPLINNGFNIEGLPDGLKAEVEVNGSITHVSQNAAGNNVVVSVKILDMAGTDVTNNFPNIVKVNGTLTITPAKLKLKGADHSFLYDGAEHSDETVTIIEGMLFESDKIDVKATGTIRNIGTVPNPVGKVTFIVGEADDYKIEKEDGKLEVTANTQARVKVTAASRSKVYDGTPLTAPDGYEVDNLPQGLRAEAIIEGSITQVKESGTGNNVVKEVKIFDADNNDVTANFPNIDKVNGNLTIMKAPITLTGADGTFNYDGKVHKNETVTKVGEFAAVDTVIYKATGTIKDVGNKPNPVEVKFITGSEDNYDIECIPGTLTVTNSSAQIVVTAEDATKRYDGTPLTNNKFKLENLPEGFTINVLIEGSITHVSENAPNNNKVKEVKIFDDDNKDVTKNFPNLMTVDGTLTITPAPLNLTGETDTFMYDGQEHKNENVIIEGLVGTDEIEAKATGMIKDVGTVPNPVGDVTFIVGEATDYILNKVDGALTVTKNTSRIIITANDATKPYDGTPLTEAGSTVEGLPEGFTAVVENEGSATHVADSRLGNNIVKSVMIVDADKNDVTESFDDVETVDGTLIITPREVTIETGSARRVYNGTPLTNADYTATGFLDFDLEEMIIRTTGSQTEVGSSSNTYEIEWGPVDKEDYEITDVLGTLTVDSVPTTPTPGPGPAPRPTPTPTAPPVQPEGEVLGARRTDSEQVLGARKDTRGTVLGARRGKTGEESNSSRLMIMAGLSALLILLAGGGKKKKG